MTDFRTYLVERAPLFGAAGALGVLASLWTDPAPSDDLEGLHQALAEESGTLVSGVAWEPSRGLLGDFFLGRPVLFEGTPGGEEEQPDIYRAFAHVTPDGRVIDVRSARNLTGTKSASEYGLGTHGALAWFGSRAESSGSITFLDLSGDKNRSLSVLERTQLGISRLVETGTWAGLGRSDFFWDGRDLSVSVDEKIHVQAGEHEKDFDRTMLFSFVDDEEEQLPYRFVYRQRKPSAWLHWAANVGRQLVGSSAVAWAEGRAFSFWDNLHQVGYSVTSPETRAPIPLPKPDATSNAEGSLWPPADIQVPGNDPTEGKWKPVQSSILPKTTEPLFYRTLIHPDPARPYAELHLVAMDMRRLEIGMGAGYEDPHPDTGPPGSGQLPTEGDVPDRVVATFNGAFKAIHGQYGMKAEGRLLVKPVMGAATVTVDAAGDTAFGTWSEETDLNSYVAFRQNLDPLVSGGRVNPNQREVWGDQLYGSGVAVERSAMCLHSSGHVLYGWATEATGDSLARGMAAAGCTYAIHLDMNPGHCAFLFNRVESVAPLKARGEPLDRRMKVNPTRFIRWSPKDFFYVATRSSAPTEGDIVWKIAPGKGPPPATIVGIFSGTQTVGGLNIEFDRIAEGRLKFAVSPGQAESKEEWETPAATNGATLIAWGLGHRTRGNRTGLTMGTSVLSPLHRTYASLIIKEGQMTLIPPAEPQTEDASTQIVQLPTLARDGQLTERARQLGGKRQRSALCLDQRGDLLVARMDHDTPAPLAQALVNLGCELVVEMDRGSHPPPLVERAGTDHPPHEGYDQTMLHGLSTPMRPRTRTF